jgi:putative transposase
VRTAFPWLRHVFADAACGGTRLAGALDRLGRWTVEIVRRGDIAWLNRNRRLAKDFEIAIAET